MLLFDLIGIVDSGKPHSGIHAIQKATICSGSRAVSTGANVLREYFSLPRQQENLIDFGLIGCDDSMYPEHVKDESATVSTVRAA